MIDYGLLVSVIAAFGIPTLLERWWPVRDPRSPATESSEGGFVDLVLGPAFAGLAVGRLVALALDDPNSIGSVADMVIIRSGVEFWPGVVAALGLVLWAERREGVQPLSRVVAILPLAMIGYASYEAACVFRDGCYGPESPVGLRPPGVASTMVPVGWIMAGLIVVAAVVMRRVDQRAVRSGVVVAGSVLAVAGVRAVGSFWLPHVGVGLTRQHVTSVVVAVLGGAAVIGLLVRVRPESTA